MFRFLKRAAAGASAAAGLWMAIAMPALPAAWLGAVLGLAAAFLALRVPAADCRLRLRREGWCELFAGHAATPGEKGAEMAASGAFEGAGWLVLRLRERQASGRRFHGAAGRILVLAPDSGSANDLRQLRVWLRLAAPRAALNSGAA